MRTLFGTALMIFFCTGIAQAQNRPLDLSSFMNTAPVYRQSFEPLPVLRSDSGQHQWWRRAVNYTGFEAAGTIIVDTPTHYLYYVLGDGKAIRYGIGVGREGFRWHGVQTVSRKAEWPSWTPPAAMLGRQPYLPRYMAGGPGNPLGSRAMYLGNTEYRIHGTNEPDTIGKNVSSGCIRLTNQDVEDLYNRVQVGTRVVVR